MDNPRKNAEGYNDPTPYEAEKHMMAQLRGQRARAAGNYFEAKHTDDDRIEFKRLTKEQQDDLEHHHKLGAVTFVLVSMGLTECYRVPWPVWRDMADTYGRKYMTRAELLPYKVPVVAGFVKFLDKLPPESITVKDLSPEELERLKKMIREQPATIIVGEVKP